jgi:hypothetical protein
MEAITGHRCAKEVGADPIHVLGKEVFMRGHYKGQTFKSVAESDREFVEQSLQYAAKYTSTQGRRWLHFLYLRRGARYDASAPIQGGNRKFFRTRHASSSAVCRQLPTLLYPERTTTPSTPRKAESAPFRQQKKRATQSFVVMLNGDDYDCEVAEEIEGDPQTKISDSE